MHGNGIYKTDAIETDSATVIHFANLHKNTRRFGDLALNVRQTAGYHVPPQQQDQQF